MQIFGINLTNTKYKDFFDEITSPLLNREGIKGWDQKIIFTPNPEILLKAKNDKEFSNILKKSDFLLPDGIGLYIAFQIIEKQNIIPPPAGTPFHTKGRRILSLPYYIFNIFFRRKYLYDKYGDKICGSDLTKDLVEYSQENNVKITIIDLYNPGDQNKVGSQEVFESKLKGVFPNLDFDYIIYNSEKKEEIVKQIKSSESKIIFSTLGMKKGEESVIELMNLCKNLKLGLSIGSSFDYFVGFQKRAPKIFGTLGIEWLYRLFSGPRKLNRLKRLYNAIFVFTWEVISKN